jgi:hypothetical protein
LEHYSALRRYIFVIYGPSQGKEVRRGREGSEVRGIEKERGEGQEQQSAPHLQ